MISQNIWRKVVGSVINNISLSNVIPFLFQMLSQLCFHLKDFTKIVWQILAALALMG